jgi:hypothetical protein
MSDISVAGSTLPVVQFSNVNCHGTISFLSRSDIHIKAQLQPMKVSMTSARLLWWAAAPVEWRASVSGSCMPFANAEQAYENTVNAGSIELTPMQSHFEITCTYPNGYYIGLGSLYVSPHVNFQVNDDAPWIVKINDGVPYRMLTYPHGQNGMRARTSPMFYKQMPRADVRSQEAILRSRSYPAVLAMYPHYWEKN